jgi:N-acetylglucosamine kinase-like BadF-type ATPase
MKWEEKKRKELGKAGREWAISDEAGFTGEKMGQRVINALDKLFDTWSPRPKFEFIDVNKTQDEYVSHELLY